MEYIPAISILAGVGISVLVKFLISNFQFSIKISNFHASRCNLFQIAAIFFVSVFSILPLVRLHPNENVYFNFLSGGLEGAVKNKFPAAGNSFGNAYYQGILWINENAQKDSKLALLQGSAINLPKNKLRSDINLLNSHFSGVNREGEYLMELTFNWEHRQNFYAWEYVDTFLEPIYEVKADGATILKVWKNDLEHTKPEYQKSEEVLKDIDLTKQDNILNIDLKKQVVLSRMIITYDSLSNCTQPVLASVETSKDGTQWTTERDPLNFKQVGEIVASFRPAWDTSKIQIKREPSDSITYYFAGRNAAYLRLKLDDTNSCLLNNPIIFISVLN